MEGWDIDRFYGQTSSSFVVGYGIVFIKPSSGVDQKSSVLKEFRHVASVLQVSTGAMWIVGGGAICWF